jgi:dihydrofolate reductase
MSKFVALNISVSEDGYMAGPNQTLDDPVGENGKLLHEWIFATQAFRGWVGGSGGSTGVDNDYVARGFENIGATIMGRNMFGPIRGPWLDESWKGWWGPNPPFGYPVFVLTHFPREPLVMGNGTVFHFVTGGIEQACEMSDQVANGSDIRIGGGAETLHQFLEAGLLDEIHLVKVPITLGSGELLFTNKDRQLQHYRALEPIKSENVIHQTYLKK